MEDIDALTKDIQAQLNQCPHVLDMDLGRTTQHMYFFNQQCKDHFLTSIQGLDRNSSDFDYQLGLALGYPEKAAQFFRDRELDKSLTWFRVCVDYRGIEFVCNFEDLDGVMQDLWSLPIPEFEDDMIEVVYYSGSPPLRYNFSTKQSLLKVQTELRMISEYRRLHYTL